MANRFYSPNQQFADGTGAPLAGGTLSFFASGTSTPLATFSDSALSVPNLNPLPLDSAGRAGNVFLQNLAYKVVLADVNSNQIWTDDPVSTSDFTAVAQFASGNGSPNGVRAGTAGSSSIPASVYWDAQNNILYVCTTTGTSLSAVWTAVNAASSQAAIPSPQGYLTLTGGTPVIPNDVVSATQVIYTQLVGNLIPIYNGATFTLQAMASDLTLVLSSSQAANTIYDVFVFNNGGTPTLVTGPAWSVSTAGSGARGTGGGTTQIGRINGLWVNSVQIIGRNGASTFTIPANQATFLGSIFIDSVAGQVTCHRTFGQGRKWAVSNAYNRQTIVLQGNDPTGSWNYQTAAWRASNANATNNLSVFSCLAEELVDAEFMQTVTMDTSSVSTSTPFNGIGVNTVAGPSGKVGQSHFATNGNSGTGGPNTGGSGSDLVAQVLVLPSLGVNTIFAIENGNGASSNTYQGSLGMRISARWRG